MIACSLIHPLSFDLMHFLIWFLSKDCFATLDVYCFSLKTYLDGKAFFDMVIVCYYYSRQRCLIFMKALLLIFIYVWCSFYLLISVYKYTRSKNQSPKHGSL